MELTPGIVAGSIGVLGACLGACLGALLPKLVRNYGKVRCEAVIRDSLAVGMVGTIPEKPSLPVDRRGTFLGAATIIFHLHIDLFNEKDTPTGLRSLAVVFQREDGPEIKAPLKESPTLLGAETRVVNLASGEWVHMELSTGFFPTILEQEGKKVELYNKAELHGVFPGGTVYRAPIRFSDSFPESSNS